MRVGVGRGGTLGAKVSDVFNEGRRVFYTQQHGDNATYELLNNVRNGSDGYDGER